MLDILNVLFKTDINPLLWQFDLPLQLLLVELGVKPSSHCEHRICPVTGSLVQSVQFETDSPQSAITIKARVNMWQ